MSAHELGTHPAWRELWEPGGEGYKLIEGYERRLLDPDGPTDPAEIAGHREGRKALQRLKSRVDALVKSHQTKPKPEDSDQSTRRTTRAPRRIH